MDHTFKILPIQYRKSQRAGYAEAGMVLLVSMAMIPVTEGVAKSNKPQFKLSATDITHQCGDQDNLTTITNLESIVLDINKLNSYASQLILVPNNATTFSASNIVPFIVRLND
eukprot:IDg15425t1